MLREADDVFAGTNFDPTVYAPSSSLTLRLSERMSMVRFRKPLPRRALLSPVSRPLAERLDLPLLRLKLSKRISLLLNPALTSESLLRRGKYGLIMCALENVREPSASHSRKYFAMLSLSFRFRSLFMKSFSLSQSGIGLAPRIFLRCPKRESRGMSGYFLERESTKALAFCRLSIEFMAATASIFRFRTAMRLTGPRKNSPPLELSSVRTGIFGLPCFGEILNMLLDLATDTKEVSVPIIERKPMSSFPPKG